MPQSSSHQYNNALVKLEQEEYQSHTSFANSQQVVKDTTSASIITTQKALEKKDWHYQPEEFEDFHYGTEELLDALPRTWSRSLLYLLVSFTAVALPWAMFSHVDETGSARGRIEPKGATQKLDTQTGGSVSSVKVKEGDTVRSGQVLLELNSDVLKSSLKEVKAKLSGYHNQLSQLQLLKNQLQLTVSTQEEQNKSRQLEKITQINQAQQNLDSKHTLYNIQKLERQALVELAQHNIQSANIVYRIAKNRLQRNRAEVERYQGLLKEGGVAQIKIVELEDKAQEIQLLHQKSLSEVKQAQLRLKEEKNRYQVVINQANSEIKQAKLRLIEQQNSYKSLVNAGKLSLLRVQEQLKDIDHQIIYWQSQVAQAQSQITSLKIRLQQHIVRSPIDGIIFELPVSKPGEVLQPGQRIAQIAPKNADLVLKAHIPSQESGFVKVGMPVKVKFDAYPFQEYGVVEGRVKWISPDSKAKQTSVGNIESYDLEVELNKQFIKNGDKQINLTPGQTATAEIVVRQRRVIDFVLDPFRKLQKSGLEL